MYVHMFTVHAHADTVTFKPFFKKLEYNSCYNSSGASHTCNCSVIKIFSMPSQNFSFI